MRGRDNKIRRKKARRERRLALAKSKKKNIVKRVNKVLTHDFNRSLWSPNNNGSAHKPSDVLNSKKSKIFDKSAWQNPPSAPRP